MHGEPARVYGPLYLFKEGNKKVLFSVQGFYIHAANTVTIKIKIL